MATTIVSIPVTPDGRVDHSWGRAPRVAVATVDDSAVTSWTEHAVRWDELHDEGTEGGHHARIARFLLDNHVQVVVAGHAGPPMVRMLGQMGIGLMLGASGDARAAAIAGAAASASAASASAASASAAPASAAAASDAPAAHD